MKLEEFTDIAQSIEPSANPNDVVIRLNSFFDEIVMDVDVIKRTASKTSESGRKVYNMTEFIDSKTEETIESLFVRLLSVRIEDVQVRHVNESTFGDHCFRAEFTDLEVGKYEGYAEGNIVLGSIAADRKIEINYSARPNITLATTDIPAPLFHPAITYRLRADMVAEQRKWDLYGAYDRRYRTLLEKAKRLVNTGHGGWHPKGGSLL